MTSRPSRRTAFRLALLLFLIGGAGGLPPGHQSLWLDETYTWWFTQLG
jgi:hypothetical protein